MRKKVIVPNKCPSCGSKRHWKKVAEPQNKPVQPSVTKAIENKLPPIPGTAPALGALRMTGKVAGKTASVATFGATRAAQKQAKKAKDKLKGNAGTYYCKKCGLKITYE